MTVLGVMLFSLAVLDLLVGMRPSWKRTATAVTAATACGVMGALAVGLSGRGAAIVGASILVEAPLWVVARKASGRWAVSVLGGLGIMLALRMATTDIWVVANRSLFERWAMSLPGDLAVRPDRTAYIGGVLAFLLTSANTCVRLLLASTPTKDRPSKPPGGGRIIGSLERVLVFGLTIAGEPTAATIVVSAKGVLRFAEVRAADGDDIDNITEYVLVGSLASITLALAFVPFALA